ncbi:helix-turn-helix domain-containing protein [Pseudactinotalea sp. Z1748]|uniref:helix-turn-helix domain-containing protein n=1 Tax=Pseudactinotalea sp. Z1748 TaxID=3413027 RepID=UPI003C7D9B56
MSLEAGFPGERAWILSPDTAREAAASPITSDLLVTHCGWYPRARHHGRTRPRGTDAVVLMVCVAARGWYADTRGRHAVAAGQALILPSGVPHSYGAATTDPWTIAWMHASGPHVRAFERALPDAGRRGVVVDMHDPVKVQGLMGALMETVEVDDRLPTVMRASGTAANVLAHLLADLRAGPPTRQEPVLRVLSHLRVHFDKPARLGELAAMAGFSTSHFSALFREATGVSVGTYIKRLRTARACELLVTTALPVRVIAQMVGYEDPLYFSRQFRNVRGCSPSAFRLRNGPTVAAGAEG